MQNSKKPSLKEVRGTSKQPPSQRRLSSYRHELTLNTRQLNEKRKVNLSKRSRKAVENNDRNQQNLQNTFCDSGEFLTRTSKDFKAKKTSPKNQTKAVEDDKAKTVVLEQIQEPFGRVKEPIKKVDEDAIKFVEDVQEMKDYFNAAEEKQAEIEKDPFEIMQETHEEVNYPTEEIIDYPAENAEMSDQGVQDLFHNAKEELQAETVEDPFESLQEKYRTIKPPTKDIGKKLRNVEDSLETGKTSYGGVKNLFYQAKGKQAETCADPCFELVKQPYNKINTFNVEIEKESLKESISEGLLQETNKTREEYQYEKVCEPLEIIKLKEEFDYDPKVPELDIVANDKTKEASNIHQKTYQRKAGLNLQRNEIGKNKFVTNENIKETFGETENIPAKTSMKALVKKVQKRLVEDSESQTYEVEKIPFEDNKEKLAKSLVTLLKPSTNQQPETTEKCHRKYKKALARRWQTVYRSIKERQVQNKDITFQVHRELPIRFEGIASLKTTAEELIINKKLELKNRHNFVIQKDNTLYAVETGDDHCSKSVSMIKDQLSLEIENPKESSKEVIDQSTEISEKLSELVEDPIQRLDGFSNASKEALSEVLKIHSQESDEHYSGSSSINELKAEIHRNVNEISKDPLNKNKELPKENESKLIEESDEDEDEILESFELKQDEPNEISGEATEESIEDSDEILSDTSENGREDAIGSADEVAEEGSEDVEETSKEEIHTKMDEISKDPVNKSKGLPKENESKLIKESDEEVDEISESSELKQDEPNEILGEVIEESIDDADEISSNTSENGQEDAIMSADEVAEGSDEDVEETSDLSQDEPSESANEVTEESLDDFNDISSDSKEDSIMSADEVAEETDEDVEEISTDPSSKSEEDQTESEDEIFEESEDSDEGVSKPLEKSEGNSVDDLQQLSDDSSAINR